MLGLDFSFLSPAAVHTLARGLLVSAQVAGVALGVGLVFGTVLAVLRLSRWRVLRLASAAYVNLFRSVPLPMVLLSFYLVVPQLLKQLFGATSMDTRMLSALVGFALFESAYYGEIMRAGILSVAHGQRAAALSLGMTPWQALRHIVLPQALRNMLPLLLTQLIVLFQDTSLVYVISLSDFFSSAAAIGERDGRVEEVMLVAALIYFGVCFSASRVVQGLQRRPSP